MRISCVVLLMVLGACSSTKGALAFQSQRNELQQKRHWNNQISSASFIPSLERRPLHLSRLSSENADKSSRFSSLKMARGKQQQQGRRRRFSLFASTTGDASASSLAAVTTKVSRGTRAKLAFLTILRVALPSLLAGVFAFFAFPQLSLWLCSLFADQGVFAVLSQDSSQFVQNFLSVSSLLFSILVGQTYYFLYQQQEMVYFALFDEVTEAKSLLEQVALVSQGRSMYQRLLKCMSTYVKSDLKALNQDPAVLLSSRPMDDPLETIMYLTSVGVPSTVYETVRSLRQARAKRLGALQRKLPAIHFAMLWLLAALELVSFPLLGAGTQTIGGYNILTIEGLLFGVMTTGIVLTLRVVGELWRPAGGAYQVDSVLNTMVKGLEKELDARTKGAIVKAQQENYPSSSK